jgi:hypothetical protein
MDKLMTTDYRSQTVEQLLAALEVAGRAPDLDLIRACLERREEVTPALLEWLAQEPRDWPDEDPRCYRAVHAGLLLIAFREPAALPLFEELLRDPSEDAQDLLEWFDTKLPAFGPPLIPALLRILGDRGATGYGRNMSSEALTEIALLHPGERERIRAALRALLPPLGEDGIPLLPPGMDEQPDPIWAWIAAALGHLGDKASREQIVALFEHDLMDDWILDLEYYLEMLAGGASLRHEREYGPEAILQEYEWLRQEVAGQAARQEERPQAPGLAQPVSETWPRELATEQPQPLVRAQPKVGRNEPCPCGSGWKYKHCCGRKG